LRLILGRQIISLRTTPVKVSASSTTPTADLAISPTQPRLVDLKEDMSFFAIGLPRQIHGMSA